VSPICIFIKRRNTGTNSIEVHVLVGRAVGQRKSINALSASELMSLRRGVAQMMAWNAAPHNGAEFRRSWVYWANMHRHFGTGCDGSIPPFEPGLGSVQTWSASNPDESATWCQCQHRNNRFLTWHRMFLWYFERVLQEAAGDRSLWLPYWDYASDPSLPKAYRDQTYVNESGQTVPNPLYVADRDTGLNSGTDSLQPSVRSAANAMQWSDFNSFTYVLERTPHDSVHGAVGLSGGGLMGFVEAAALDPIFYAHHTNIDRLYECWLGVDELARLPTYPPDLNAQYTFVDADGSTPQRQVRDMLRTSQLGYAYTQGADCPGIVVASAEVNMSDAPASASQSETLAAFVGPIHLQRGVTVVTLDLTQDARTLLSSQGSLSGGRRAYVAIEGLAFDERPRVLYNVYLQGRGSVREQIGVVSFFALSSGGDAHNNHGTGANDFKFDATDAVKRLVLGADASPALILEPTTGLTSSSPEAASERIPQKANVRFESAKIVVEE
jgi:hypothetical protein